MENVKNAFMNEYTDKNGKFSHDLMNKEFIQRAHKSEQVSKFISDGVNVDDIIVFLVINKVNSLLRDTIDNFSNEDALKLIANLDDLCKRSAFKDLKLWLRGKK